MQRVYILIGVPGAGKSTWAASVAAHRENTVIINRDSIRTMIKGKYNFVPALEPLVSEMSQHAIFAALKRGYDVIVDECHITREKRWKTVDYIRSNHPEVAIGFVQFVSDDLCLIRRCEEPRGYTKEKWAKVHDAMMNAYEPVGEPGEEVYDYLIKIEPGVMSGDIAEHLTAELTPTYDPDTPVSEPMEEKTKN
jgi:predicted kinase